MRLYFLTAAIFFSSSSFLARDFSFHRNSKSKMANTKSIFDLRVRRLSGERVIISWHTEGDQDGVLYEVLRRHKKGDQFISLGTSSPELKQENTADYLFVDANNFEDSSYYCLKKTNVDSVVFYSITKGVEGVLKDR